MVSLKRVKVGKMKWQERGAMRRGVGNRNRKIILPREKRYAHKDCGRRVKIQHMSFWMKNIFPYPNNPIRVRQTVLSSGNLLGICL